MAVMSVLEIAAEVTAKLGDGDLRWTCRGCGRMYPIDGSGALIAHGHAHDPGLTISRECPGSGTVPQPIGSTLWCWRPHVPAQ